jgi:hypothetical protein
MALTFHLLLIQKMTHQELHHMGNRASSFSDLRLYTQEWDQKQAELVHPDYSAVCHIQEGNQDMHHVGVLKQAEQRLRDFQLEMIHSKAFGELRMKKSITPGP